MAIIKAANGQSVEVNFYDLDFRANYTKAFETYKEKSQNVPKEATEIEVLSYLTDVSQKLIVSVFGKKTAKRLFDGRDLRAYFDFTRKLVKEQLKADKEFEELSNDIQKDLAEVMTANELSNSAI